MAKKKKGKKSDNKKQDEEKRTECLAGCGKKLSEGQTDFCSESCEIAHLKGALAEKDEKLEQLSRRKGPVRCYGRVEWIACMQEWYTKRSFDAKRRASELRKLGFNCHAQGVGELPVANGDGKVEQVKMTVLTCDFKQEENGEMIKPVEPENYVEGLDRWPEAVAE